MVPRWNRHLDHVKAISTAHYAAAFANPHLKKPTRVEHPRGERPYNLEWIQYWRKRAKDAVNGVVRKHRAPLRYNIPPPSKVNVPRHSTSAAPKPQKRQLTPEQPQLPSKRRKLDPNQLLPEVLDMKLGDLPNIDSGDFVKGAEMIGKDTTVSGLGKMGEEMER